jgi:uncharacterized protein YbcI
LATELALSPASASGATRAIHTDLAELFRTTLGRRTPEIDVTVLPHAVVCLTSHGFTSGESTLTSHGHAKLVWTARRAACVAAEQQLCEAVERHTGRTVLSMFQDSDPRRELDVLIFLLAEETAAA